MTYYQHKYGGIYKKITEAIDNDTGIIKMVYKHVYPFENIYYISGIDDFKLNFRRIDDETALRHMSKDRQQFQRKVTINKNCNHEIFSFHVQGDVPLY